MESRAKKLKEMLRKLFSMVAISTTSDAPHFGLGQSTNCSEQVYRWLGLPPVLTPPSRSGLFKTVKDATYVVQKQCARVPTPRQAPWVPCWVGLGEMYIISSVLVWTKTWSQPNPMLRILSHLGFDVPGAEPSTSKKSRPSNQGPVSLTSALRSYVFRLCEKILNLSASWCHDFSKMKYSIHSILHICYM